MTATEIVLFVILIGISLILSLVAANTHDSDIANVCAGVTCLVLLLAGAIALGSTHDSLANLSTHENQDQVYGCVQDKTLKSIVINSDGTASIKNTDGSSSTLIVNSSDPSLNDPNQVLQPGVPYCSNPTWGWHTAGTLTPAR